MEKDCNNCLYKHKSSYEFPCSSCVRNCIDKWEEECGFCQKEIVQNVDDSSTVFELGYKYCPICGRKINEN